MDSEIKLTVKKGDEWIAEALVKYLNEKVHDFIRTCQYIICDDDSSTDEKKRDILKMSLKFNNEVSEVIGFMSVYFDLLDGNEYKSLIDNFSEVIASIRQQFANKINLENN